jgi:hypothetical protein
MAAKDIKLNLDLNTKDAQRAVKDLNKELSNTDDSLEDVESAGKQMARAIEKAADDTIDEIEKTKRAVDALETALDGFDADPTKVVGDLKKMGLTSEEIEADAEELAAAIKRIDDVKLSAAKAGFDDLDEALGRTDSSGRAAGAAIGGVGGSISELPGVGTLGPIAESMGQLAEGALEGEVNMKQLLGAGLALGAVALVAKGIEGRFSRIAESKAWKKEQIESYTDALKDTDSAVDAVAQKLRDSEELTFSLGEGLIKMDLLPQIAKAGLGVEEFSELVAGGTETINKWAEAQRSAGNDTEAVNAVVLAATQETAFFAEAQEAAAISAQFFGEEEDNAAESADVLAEKTSAARERVDELTESMVEAAGGAYDMEQAELDLADSVADLESAYTDYEAIVNDAASTDAEKAQASRDLRNQEIATAEQALATAQAYATEKGAVDGSVHSARLQVEKLRELQGQYPNNAAAIQPYIDKLLAVPGVVDTTVNANTAGANSALDSIIGKLRGIGANVTTASVVAATRFRQYAKGTQYAPSGPAIINEEGGEIVDLPSGAKVIPAGKSADMLRNMSGGSTSITNVYQNFPAGTRPSDVIAAQKKHERRNGPQ